MSERAKPQVPVDLPALIPAGHVFARLAAPDKAVLLAEFARRSAASVGLPAEEIRAALVAREDLGSTGVGAGIAVPHARLAGLSAPLGFFARLERPIEFAAIDDVKVDLVFLLLSPVQAHSAHLASLAAVSRRLRRLDIAQAIRNAGSTEEIRALLVAAEG